jgi:hypothetical protein
MAKTSPRVAERRSMAGKNKPTRQVETSMSKKYKGTPKVSQTTISNIKKMGMSAALKKAGTSKNPEYLEGVKRMYGAARLKKAQSSPMKKAAAPAQKRSPRVAERTMQKKSPRVSERTASAAASSSNKIPAGYKRAKTGQLVKKTDYKLPRLVMGVKQYK